MLLLLLLYLLLLFLLLLLLFITIIIILDHPFSVRVVDTIKRYEDTLKSLEEKRLVASKNSIVLEQLEQIFGPRIIQHFVFSGVLKQLELIANEYLNILAVGGIRLSLQGDLNADRIVKSVSISYADGTHKERALSQLSGGQWRRVSMALDFAFVEIIRRRGLLRCNMIVMDEILTHLDTSGREAVGTVLGALVHNPSDNKNEMKLDNNSSEEFDVDVKDVNSSFDLKDDNNKKINSLESIHKLLGGGRYETVIVILQDLAAVELEESFDHVDIVVKDPVSATVLIDGKMEISYNV